MKIFSPEERRRKQYDLEHLYQQKILHSPSAEERRQVYKDAYDALYDFSVQFSMDQDRASHFKVSKRMYRSFLEGKVGVDFGCGDGTTTLAMAAYAKKVTGIDLDLRYLHPDIEKIQREKPGAVDFQEVAGVVEIPFPDASLDFVFSQHVFEHLHPDDAHKHLVEAHRVLKPGGVFIFITPNRLYGPHDISRYFLPRGAVAGGLHIKEYSYAEVLPLVHKIGWKNIRTPLINEHVLHMLHLDSLTARLSFRPGYKIRCEIFFAKRSMGRVGYVISAVLRLRSVVFFCEK